MRRLHPRATAILVLVLHTVSLEVPSHGWWFVLSLACGCATGWLLGILSLDADRWRRAEQAVRALTARAAEPRPLSRREAGEHLDALHRLDATRPDQPRVRITNLLSL